MAQTVSVIPSLVVGLRLLPIAAAPKIFFRYYYVSSSTREKTGTMLAEVKWAGGEP